MPSFSTDSPLDHEIKFALIHNTFRLLNLTHHERLRWQRKSMMQAQVRLYGDLFDRKRRPQSAERHRTESPAPSTTSSSSKLQQATSRLSSSSSTGGRDSRSASPSVANKNSDVSNKPVSNDATPKTRPAKASDKAPVPDEVTQYWQRYLENEAEQLGLFDLVFPTDVYPNQPTQGKQAVYDDLLGLAGLVFQEGFTAVRAFPPPICIDTNSARTTGGGSKDGRKTRTPATATDRSSGSAKPHKPKTRIKQKKSKSKSASPVVMMAEEPLTTSATAATVAAVVASPTRPPAAMKLPLLAINTNDPVAFASLGSTPVSVASSQLSSLTASSVDGRPCPVPPSPMSIRASFQHASPQRKTSISRATAMPSASSAPFDPIAAPQNAASAQASVPVADAAVSVPSRVPTAFPDTPDEDWGGLTKLQHERMVALLRIAQVSEPSDATATDDDGGDDDDDDDDDDDGGDTDAAYHHHEDDDHYDNDDNDDLYAEYDDSSHQEMSDTDDLLWSPEVTPVGSHSASFHGPQGHYNETICRQYGDSMAAAATTKGAEQGGDHSDGDGDEWAVDEYPDQSLYISYVQEDDDNGSSTAAAVVAASSRPAVKSLAAAMVSDANEVLGTHVIEQETASSNHQQQQAQQAQQQQHVAADNHRFARQYAAVAPLIEAASPMSPKAVASSLSSSSFTDDAKAMRNVVSVAVPSSVGSPRASPSKGTAFSVNASILLNSSLAAASFHKAAEGAMPPVGSPAVRPAVASPSSPPNAADLAGAAPPLNDFQAQYSAYRAQYLSAYRMAQQPPASATSSSSPLMSASSFHTATTAAANYRQYATYK